VTDGWYENTPLLSLITHHEGPVDELWLQIVRLFAAGGSQVQCELYKLGSECLSCGMRSRSEKSTVAYGIRCYHSFQCILTARRIKRHE